MRRVLYVEDNETNSMLGVRVLELTGELQVTHAATGEIAMELLRGDRFDALVLDLDLPGVGGIELLEWMKENAITLPTVVVTASVMARERQRTTELGVRSFLEKPVDINKMRACVLAAAG